MKDAKRITAKSESVVDKRKKAAVRPNGRHSLKSQTGAKTSCDCEQHIRTLSFCLPHSHHPPLLFLPSLPSSPHSQLTSYIILFVFLDFYRPPCPWFWCCSSFVRVHPTHSTIQILPPLPETLATTIVTFLPIPFPSSHTYSRHHVRSSKQIVCARQSILPGWPWRLQLQRWSWW